MITSLRYYANTATGRASTTEVCHENLSSYLGIVLSIWQIKKGFRGLQLLIGSAPQNCCVNTFTL